MAKKDKVVDLFQEMVRKAKKEDQKNKPSMQVSGNGHVFVSGGEPTINVYNQKVEG